MNKIYYTEITDVVDAGEISQFSTFFTEKRTKQINLLYFDRDKKLSLLSELLVRVIICKTLNICNNEITFEKNKYGKPYLLKYCDFQFNISHAKDVIAIAISDKPVGIDVEPIREAPLQVANRFFTESEVSYMKQTNNDRDKRFYEIWTKKEAYVKYTGEGLSN